MDKLLTILLWLALIQGMSAASCNDYQTCENCTARAGEPTNCRWCSLSRQCHNTDNINDPCPEIIDHKEVDECPKDKPKPYNDTAAFEHLLLSAVAYSSEPDSCLAEIKQIHPEFDYEVYDNNLIARRCDNFFFDYKVCAAIVTVSHSNKKIVLSYRGTAQFGQLLEEFFLTLSKKRDFGAGKVHSYFYNAFEQLKPCAVDRIKAMMEQYPDYSVTVSGHSLGGAVASMMAFHLVDSQVTAPTNTSLFTFGQPRTGSKVYAVEHDQLVPSSYRIVHHRDAVALIPPCLKCESGDKDTNYHHGLEVFFETKGMARGTRHKICKANQDLNCSTKYTNLFTMLSTVAKPWLWWSSYSDHVEYYGILLLLRYIGYWKSS